MSRAADLHVMTKAAEKASYGIIRDFGELEKLQVSKKGFKNFVTSSDRRAEEQIMYVLSTGRPEFSFVCEESGVITNKNPDVSWVVDPIDGTTNFMRGIPYFAINIAIKDKEEIVAGITLDPMRGDCFKADIGCGTFLGRQRLRTSGKEELKESVVATHMSLIEDVKVAEKGAIIRRTGAVALDLAYLAAGKYDAVVAKNVGIWDIASGILLIKEAGGFVKYEDQGNGKYKIIAASSSKLFNQVSEICW